jgi:hypothetical protein
MNGLFVAAASAITVVALALAACGSSNSGSPGTASSSSPRRSPSSPSAVGPSSQQSMVAFSRCMRSCGVARFPDPLPGAGGSLPKVDPKKDLGVSIARFQSAKRACQHWIPSTPGIVAVGQCESSAVCLAAETARLLNAGLRMARCMRAHGVPSWPDPDADSLGRVAFPISISRDGFDPNSPQLSGKEDVCATGGIDVGWAVSP